MALLASVPAGRPQDAPRSIGLVCGRFSQGNRSEWLAERFGALIDGDLPPGRYNMAPTDPIRIVTERDGRRLLTSAEWGFRPFWRERAAGQRGWINARAETALESRTFGPVNDRLFAFAGIWTDAKHGDSATAAILTIGANDAIAKLHRRMPVILEEVDVWLAADTSLEEIATMLMPAPDDAVRIWPVGTAVNSVRNDGPELLRPADAVSLGLA